MGFENVLKEHVMNKRLLFLSVPTLPFLLSGCSAVGEKSANVSFVYLLTFIAALLLLLVYCVAPHKKSAWTVTLFLSISVVNGGYTLLAFSKTLDVALWGNRIAYLGSVFLPIAMIMIFLNISDTAYKKYLPAVLAAIGFAVFIVAASPGFSDIYYKEVSLKVVNGATVLDKVYGEWHSLYLYYLISTFAVMIFITVRATLQKKLKSPTHIAFMFIAVFGNICVWLLEQLVSIEFEILSISYIFTELFLLAISFMFQERQGANAGVSHTESGALQGDNSQASVSEQSCVAQNDALPPEITAEQISMFKAGMAVLTKTERAIFKMYTDGDSTKDIMSALDIKENTLKYHNKNIYGKLGVKSRKQLLLIFKYITD